MEDLYQSFAVDLVSGAGVPALLSIGARDPGLGLAAAGAVLGVVLSLSDRLRGELKWARSILAISLSARQFFSIMESKDSDVGAGLVAIPFFFMTCIMPMGSASEYFRHARTASSVLNAAVLVAAGIYFSDSEGARPLATSFGGGLGQALAVLDAAYSAAQPAWASAHPWWVAAGRGAVFLGLSAAPRVALGLVGGSRPTWLNLAYSACLVQSAQVHACHVRTQLSGADPQRRLMLMVAGALTLGFSERDGDPAVASFLCLGLTGACVLLWGAGTKLVQRRD